MLSAVAVAGILCWPHQILPSCSHPFKWHDVCHLPSPWFHVNAALACHQNVLSCIRGCPPPRTWKMAHPVTLSPTLLVTSPRYCDKQIKSGLHGGYLEDFEVGLEMAELAASGRCSVCAVVLDFPIPGFPSCRVLFFLFSLHAVTSGICILRHGSLCCLHCWRTLRSSQHQRTLG